MKWTQWPRDPHAARSSPPSSPLEEGPVHRHRLAQQVLAVHAPNGRLRFLLLEVLDQRVALHEARAAVEVEVDVFHLAELREFVQHVVLLRLLVDARHKDDPTFDGCRHAGAARKRWWSRGRPAHRMFDVGGGGSPSSHCCGPAPSSVSSDSNTPALPAYRSSASSSASMAPPPRPFLDVKMGARSSTAAAALPADAAPPVDVSAIVSSSAMVGGDNNEQRCACF